MPIKFGSNEKPYAVLCMKTSNVYECYQRFVDAGENVTDITYTWNNERFPEFNVTDPSGNIINIANYPDLLIDGF